MKALDLDNIIEALEAIGTEKESDFEIRVPKELAEKAEVSINRMIEFS